MEEDSSVVQTLGGRLTRHGPLFSQDSTLLYTSTGRTIRIFRASDGRLIRSHPLAVPEKSCDLSKKLKKALETCGQFLICKPALPCVNDISSLAWSKEHLVVSHFGGLVRFLDKEDLCVARKIFVDGFVLQVFVADDTLFAFCASTDKHNAVYSELLRLRGDTFLPIFRHKGIGRISCCGSTAAFAFGRSFISICLADAKPVWTQRRHTLPITAIAVKEEDAILVGDTKGVITRYTLASKQCSLMHWHSSRVQALCFTSNYFLSGGLESVLVYWQDTEKGFLPRLAQNGGIVDIRVSPNELQAAVAVADNTIHVVNLSTNLIEATLSGLKHRSTQILSVEPTRSLVLVDSVRRGAMQLYDTQLDCGFEELDISPLPWISPVESTASSKDGQGEYFIAFTHARYGRDAQHVWLATTEQRHADIAASQALKFWTVEPDGTYHLRTIIEDSHRLPIHSLRSCTLTNENDQSEFVFLSSDANMFKIWRQVALQRRNGSVTSWCCSVALRARGILSVDISHWRGFTLVAILMDTGVQVYEVLGTEVELACQLLTKTTESILEVSIIDGHVVLRERCSISVYSLVELNNKIELNFLWSMSLKNIVALCSFGPALAVLTSSKVFVYPSVAKPTHRKACMSTSVQRIAFLSQSTLIGLTPDAIIKVDIIAKDEEEDMENDAVGQDDAGRKLTAYAALNRNVVSLSSPPPTSDVDLGGAAAAMKAKKPRLRKFVGKKAMNEEEALLRLTASHELPPMESLFEHLLEKA